jgi:hypothetical protein
VLGLALPGNSIIAQKAAGLIGQAFSSNLFAAAGAPAASFLSLALSRPGSNTVPAVLGLGAHPPALVPDPSRVQYSPVASAGPSQLFWQAAVQKLTIFVDGKEHDIPLGQSVAGGPNPIATLDSGAPVIATTTAIANALYGALGVSPAADSHCEAHAAGLFERCADALADYLPCNTPMNVSITLNGVVVPLHPLDLSSPPLNGGNPGQCQGIIQASAGIDGLLQTTRSDGDMILGVPFLRNVYAVLAYGAPNTDGSFPPGAGAAPHLGLLPLTDPATAAAEFGKSLVGGGRGSGSSGGSDAGSTSQIALIVGAAVGGFFVLCAVLFGARWAARRRGARADAAAAAEGEKDREAFARAFRSTAAADANAGYTLAHQDTLRAREAAALSTASLSYGPEDATLAGTGAGKSARASFVPRRSGLGADELGVLELGHDDPWDPRSATVAAHAPAWGGPAHGHARTPSGAPLLRGPALSYASAGESEGLPSPPLDGPGGTRPPMHQRESSNAPLLDHGADAGARAPPFAPGAPRLPASGLGLPSNPRMRG